MICSRTLVLRVSPLVNPAAFMEEANRKPRVTGLQIGEPAVWMSYSVDSINLGCLRAAVSPTLARHPASSAGLPDSLIDCPSEMSCYGCPMCGCHWSPPRPQTGVRTTEIDSRMLANFLFWISRPGLGASWCGVVARDESNSAHLAAKLIEGNVISCTTIWRDTTVLISFSIATEFINSCPGRCVLPCATRPKP